MKKETTPTSRNDDVLKVNPPWDLVISGRRCRKVSPRSAPAAKEMSTRRLFWSVSGLRERVTAPTSESALTMITETNANTQVESMLRNIRAGRLSALVLLIVGLAACGVNTVSEGPPGGPSATPEVLTVSGYITEIEAGQMSLRTFDNLKQLIISLEDSPVPVATLQIKMDSRQPIRVTYRIETGKLVPIEIADAPVTPVSPTPGPTYDASY